MKKVLSEYQRQLHDALGLDMRDLQEFTWSELIDIVRKETQKLIKIAQLVA
jgi:hypothetical protein